MIFCHEESTVVTQCKSLVHMPDVTLWCVTQNYAEIMRSEVHSRGYLWQDYQSFVDQLITTPNPASVRYVLNGSVQLQAYHPLFAWWTVFLNDR